MSVSPVQKDMQLAGMSVSAQSVRGSPQCLLPALLLLKVRLCTKALAGRADRFCRRFFRFLSVQRKKRSGSCFVPTENSVGDGDV